MGARAWVRPWQRPVWGGQTQFTLTKWSSSGQYVAILTFVLLDEKYMTTPAPRYWFIVLAPG